MNTLQTANWALKALYLGVIAEHLNTQTNPLLARIEQTSSDVWGKEVRKVIADEDKYKVATLALKDIHATIEISDRVIRALDNNCAFINLLQNELEELIHAAKFNLGRMLCGDGSGKLCTITSYSGNEIIVDNVNNVTEGMEVDIISNTNKSPVVYSSRILRVDYKSKKIVLDVGDVAGEVTAGDFLTMLGRYNRELTGLGAIFGNSETLYGLQRATNKWLNPHKYTIPAINNEVIQSVIDELDAAGSAVDFIMCSNGVKRAYQDYLIANRINMDVISLQGGYKAINYNGIPVVSDHFVPNGTMYLLNTADFHLHQLCDWQWVEDDCGKIIRPSRGGIYAATLVKYADLICDRPIGQAMISGIAETK